MVMRSPCGVTSLPSRRTMPADCSSARGLAQHVAVLPGAVGDRRHERRAEHLVGQLAAERLEQRHLFGARRAFGHHLRILEQRDGALIGSVHDVPVGPFEIEGIDQGFAQAAVLELLAPRVDEPALRSRGGLVGQLLALHAAVPDGRKIVTRRPDPRGELLAEQIALGGEALERHVAVAVELEAHDVEIVLPARDRQVGAPPVLDPLVLDEAAGLEAPDLVGARAERHLEASIPRTAWWRNRRARRSAAAPRTAARRARARPRTAPPRSRRRPPPRRPCRAVSWWIIGWPFSFRTPSENATSAR